MRPDKSHRRPLVVAFDVVGTLFALEPLKARMKEAGLPETALAEWFSRFLHAAVALDMVDVFVPFREVATATLEVMAAQNGLASAGSVAENVIQALYELPAHTDVRPAFQGLQEAGIRLIALTNGSAQNTQHLLKLAELDGYIERIVAIEEVRHWKPRAEVYRYAASVVGVPPVRMCLVAAHAWDILGANHAGLLTAWVARQEKRFYAAMGAADITGHTLTDIATTLMALPE